MRNAGSIRSEEHTSELQSQSNLVCRLLLEKKKKSKTTNSTNSNAWIFKLQSNNPRWTSSSTISITSSTSAESTYTSAKSILHAMPLYLTHTRKEHKYRP